MLYSLVNQLVGILYNTVTDFYPRLLLQLSPCSNFHLIVFYLFWNLFILYTLLVEEMNGRWLGEYNRSVGLQKLHDTFQRNFNSSNSPYTAIPLGVAGDTASNVLWRLLNGEMPDRFNPKIWWINIGMNDLTRKKVRRIS